MPARKRTAARPRRVVAAPLLWLSLDKEIRRLRKEPEWRSGDRNSVTLVNTPDFGVILTVLRKGASICGHAVEGSLILTALTGAVRFSAQRETRTLKRNDAVTLRRGISHDVEALRESTLLLVVLRR